MSNFNQQIDLSTAIMCLQNSINSGNEAEAISYARLLSASRISIEVIVEGVQEPVNPIYIHNAAGYQKNFYPDHNLPTLAPRPGALHPPPGYQQPPPGCQQPPPGCQQPPPGYQQPPPGYQQPPPPGYQQPPPGYQPPPSDYQPPSPGYQPPPPVYQQPTIPNMRPEKNLWMNSLIASGYPVEYSQNVCNNLNSWQEVVNYVNQNN